MTAKDRLGMIGMGATAAFLSGLAVLVFDRDPVVPRAEALAEYSEPDTVAAPKGARLTTADTEQEQEQFQRDDVPGNTLDLRTSYPADHQADLTPGENPDGWSAQTRESEVAIAQPQAPSNWDTDVSAPAAAKSESLPWKSATQPPAPAASERSLDERLAEISPQAKKRIAGKFESANAAWPPAEIALIALKDKKVVDLYARRMGGAWQHIYRYPVLAASGLPGPKLRQGDKQVPEGIYNISFLNPNSRYHVSMRLNYPNDFDRQMAAKDGRKELGGDIMIHGKAVSIGCLAMGDEAAEELFVLASETGLPNVKVIIAPADFRKDSVPQPEPGQPAWLPKLYTQVASALTEFPAPPSSGLLSFFGN